MDYTKLAELLYPNCKYTVDELEKKYPKRNLVEGTEVTRIAPSPTGFLHIGTAYGAMIDKLIAGDNGIFYIRLEDTDKKREIKDTGDIAYDMLCYYDIEPNEGFMSGGREIGNYGPYTQSKRLEIYKTFAKELVKKGNAFPCFCEKAGNKKEVEERRKQELEETCDIETKDLICRELSFEEIEIKIKNGEKFALKLKSGGDAEKSFKFFDLIKGEREIRENVKDIVLIKSNGIPVYAFAHAVDDHLMRTTIVVRGEEWFPSLSSHLEIFDALGFERVKYLHTPVLCKLDENGNKRKLSKRKDPEADSRYFVKMGIPVIAINEYLLNIINSDFEIWRANNTDVSYKEFPFSISKMGSNNPMFDLIKLSDVSKTIISKMTAEEVFEYVFTWAKEFDLEFACYLESNKDYVIKVFSIDRYNLKPRKDLAKWSEVKDYFSYMFEPYFNLKSIKDYEILENKSEITENDKKMIKNINIVVGHYLNIYDDYEDKQEWFENIKNMANYLGFAVDNKEYKANPEKFKGNVADVCMYIRLALTGRKNSPDIYEISKILGKENTIKRLQNLANLTK
ncbi:MAG: glutamate--tRNA ligase family protein [Clostridia bacterium]|nr:glutamate--tRNA ligase family protein [Clostridia bacterium]